MIAVLSRSFALFCLVLLGALAHAQTALHAEEVPHVGMTMYVFMSETCPHCRAQKPFLANLDSYYPSLDIRHMEIMSTREHHDLLRNMASLHGVQPGSVPMIFFGGKVWVGDSSEIRHEIVAHVEACLTETGCPR